MRFRSARDGTAVPLVRRAAQVGTAGVFAAIVVVTFVLGVIKTHDAKQVEASGPNGLQATSSLLAQRSLTLPATAGIPGPTADRGLRPAVDLALRVPGRDLLLLRARRRRSTRPSSSSCARPTWSTAGGCPACLASSTQRRGRATKPGSGPIRPATRDGRSSCSLWEPWRKPCRRAPSPERRPKGRSGSTRSSKEPASSTSPARRPGWLPAPAPSKGPPASSRGAERRTERKGPTARLAHWTGERSSELDPAPVPHRSLRPGGRLPSRNDTGSAF